MPELARRTFKLRATYLYCCPICSEPMKFQQQISVTNWGRWIHTACLARKNQEEGS